MTQVHLRARDCLERATALEPSYADGWAWLAVTYLGEYRFGLNPRPDPPLDRALRAAQRAVAVDPASQIAHVALASTHYHRREHEQFVAQAEQALALNSNNALVLAQFGLFFTQSGQLERGVALMKAMMLNPNHPGWYHVALMNGHFFKGEYEHALVEALNAMSKLPDSYWMHANLAAVYGHLGRRKEAQAVIASLLKLYPDFPKKARQEIRIWILDDRDTERWLDGLRKAGLEIPLEPR